MQGSGNVPPWKLAAKARYANYDGDRAQKYFRKSAGEYYGDNPKNEMKLWSTPPFFPILSLLVRLPVIL
jgi:glutathione S-transferase kappa 1